MKDREVSMERVRFENLLADLSTLMKGIIKII